MFDNDERRLQLEMAMQRLGHPVITETRQYFWREFLKRMHRSIFPQAPLFVLMVPVALSFADYIIGNAPCYTVVEYANSTDAGNMLELIGELYLVGLLFSMWEALFRPWSSPMQDTIDLYMELDYAMDRVG